MYFGSNIGNENAVFFLGLQVWWKFALYFSSMYDPVATFEYENILLEGILKTQFQIDGGGLVQGTTK